MEIVPFTDDHLDAAAELLAARHERHRAAEPLLPADLDFRAEVEKEWHADGASGVFSPHGYLFGAPDPRGWFTVGLAGHAVTGDPEHLRDLYAAAAQRWVDSGHSRQMVFVPVSDSGPVDAWFRLTFGASAVNAMRETERESYDGGVTIRRGTHDELATTVSLDRAMHESMLPSPSAASTSRKHRPCRRSAERGSAGHSPRTCSPGRTTTACR